jgi:hypothetical protein
MTEPNLYAIPPELRQLPQWVLYRIQTRNDRTTKIPYQAAHPRKRASTTDPATWGTFQTAAEAHARGRGDGIGFVFTASDPYIGIDLDQCLHNGVLKPEAAPTVKRLWSYTELSPGGNGLHIIGRGHIGDGRRTSRTPWGGELEMYDRGRYFTMTGRRHHDDTPGELLELPELDAIRAELLPDPAPVLRGLATPVHLDDRDLLDRAFAAANGPKFRALWQGEINGYASASEAELALINMIAFWTGPDEHRIDQLFRQSGLIRPKWEQREEYRAATIAKALNGRTEYYGQPPAPARLEAVTTPETALQVATAAIKMEGVPLVDATERRGGRIVLERADGVCMTAANLGVLATFAKLAGELAAQFGHELDIPKDQKTATAHRFVAALRRHIGPGKIDALEQRFEGWLIELAHHAKQIPFTSGDATSRLHAWQALDEADPDAERGATGYAKKILVPHDTNTGDRYLRASWAQEYIHRCGWRGGLEEAVGLLETIGLEQPNPRSDGRVRARRRTTGETLVFRFWVIPAGHFEHWQTG